MTPEAHTKTRDAAATKERILGAATDEFTERGFAGARVDDIAGRAQVNKALLYQYFGDKEALFKAVLEAKMARLAEIAAEGSPERLPEVVGEFFDFHARNPGLTRLMQWEALDFGTERVPDEDERARRFGEHVGRLERAQEAGVVDADLDARQTLVTMIGVVTFWFACPQTARLICGGDPYSREALAARRAHVVEVARKILERRD